jgi:pullulanase-type alpha-1,6-glucosidase
VEVYLPATGRVEKNLVTDPYAVSLSTNSRRSQVVNLGEPRLKPAGWDGLSKPALEALEDAVIYELHVRDFSIGDESVPPALRGKFLAFTQPESHGMRHLRALAEAGLTHIHLLPAFDFVSVDDIPARRQEPDWAALRALPPDSEAQQAAVAAIQDRDGFNWGYDPWHYGAPEGSYATEPDGPARILEFRSMVQALNRAGLRVVMDVVYNHTAWPVLDRVAPGYYYRLNADGQVESSTCGGCCNTATEHAMMEKLMLDTLHRWATAYKVDGFRFDLMGHHLRDHLAQVRGMLDGLTLEREGVDGQKILVYGEGWDFGEVAQNGRGVNACQRNLGGLGIGSFNDRLRDGARGGRPFSGLQDQGFVTGLFQAPNGVPPSDEQSPATDPRAWLLHYADWIRIGLAGNLRDYALTDSEGRRVTGAELDYYGSPAGYAVSPRECVNYISAHDNETLFDALQLKLPRAMPRADRLRLYRLGLSLVLLGQGIPFFHAGDDLLRSKSLDRNSYNSGDWFNRLDFTYHTNNWGVGLPPAGDNAEHWPVMQPLLADPALKPSRDDILATAAHFREMLRVRKSSRLFRLRTAGEVEAALTFQNTGPEQIPGLIALTLSGEQLVHLASPWERIAVIFNATPAEQAGADPAWAGGNWALHPTLADSADPVVRSARFAPGEGGFSVPAYTTAVFVA